MLISSKIRWVGHVTYLQKGKGVYKVLISRPDGKSHLEGLDVEGILKEYARRGVAAWNVLIVVVNC